MNYQTSPRCLKQSSLELLQEYKQFPCQSIRNQIVQLNRGLVRKEVHHWIKQCSESYDDLLQVGCIGLIQAIERFDLTKGCAFSSFAVPYIRGEILHYLRDKSSLIRVPRHYLKLKRQGSKVVAQLQEKLHRKPTDLEIANTLGISVEQWNQVKLAEKNSSVLSHYLRDKSSLIRVPRHYLKLKRQGSKVVAQLQEKLHRKPTDLEIANTLGISVEQWNQVKLAEKNSSVLSLDATFNDEFEDQKSLVELIVDPNYNDFKTAHEDKIDLEMALLKLKEKNRYILELVFFKNLTYKEVAKHLGISMITVHRRIKQSLKDLKVMLTSWETLV
ncbi:sigma-70 family RNA polymerase sigma factor [Limnoraphis robusta]|uniref:RNA polymerase sigma factor SigF n=1 Tax=Limnoraphis robusta CS-951 TaxID=1637645 RepID=A0A0J9EV61_9CYAN|nr:RNA polymerase sigma factor SigF [Limnoraphis robusta CS-951]